MRVLTEQTGETSLLHVISGSESVCIEKIASPLPVHVTYEIGHRGPLYAGCSGKSLLAFLPPPEIETILARLDFRPYTRRTIASVEQLRPELSETRARGYAESTGELDEGVSSVGVPLLDGAGAVRAAIVLVCPTGRWSGSHRERCIAATVEAGRMLCRRLGGERYYEAPGRREGRNCSRDHTTHSRHRSGGADRLYRRDVPHDRRGRVPRAFAFSVAARYRRPVRRRSCR